MAWITVITLIAIELGMSKLEQKAPRTLPYIVLKHKLALLELIFHTLLILNLIHP